MREYTIQIMTKEQAEEIDVLWKDGHAEALTAFAFEAVEAYKTGERTAMVIGTCAGVAIFSIAAAAIHITKRLRQKHENKKTDT